MDWTSNTNVANSPFTAEGTMTTPTSIVNVTFNSTNAVSFIQKEPNDSQPDYFQQILPSGQYGRNPATSPYTSAEVDNIPTAKEMIAFNAALEFSLTFEDIAGKPLNIANSVFPS